MSFMVFKGSDAFFFKGCWFLLLELYVGCEELLDIHEESNLSQQVFIDIQITTVIFAYC